MQFSAAKKGRVRTMMTYSAEVTCLGKAIVAQAERMGNDLCVMVTGGEEPHFGSVSLGISRKSLTGSGETSATVSTMNMTGHKDDAVGNRFAERLAVAFECRAIVSCGIHYEGAEAKDLSVIRDSTEDLLNKLIQGIKAEQA